MDVSNRARCLRFVCLLACVSMILRLRFKPERSNCETGTLSGGHVGLRDALELLVTAPFGTGVIEPS